VIALKGLDELVRTLNQIGDSGVKKAAKAGINAGLGALAKECRSAINSSSASPEMKAAARKTIGKRLKKLAGEYVGKVGFAVGKSSKAKVTKAKARAGDKSQTGVGISAANIHWPVLGTRERRTNKGYSRGKMPADLKGVIERAVSTAGPAMFEAARAKISTVLAAEAAKARK
jgi:ElaB/YqjD/DUF883 family membrane-anchored ribosome-binding protein